MELSWDPHVYHRLIIDHRFDRYLILNADYADWIFLDQDEFTMFTGLDQGVDPERIVEEYSISSGLAREEAEREFKKLLAKLRFNQIVFSPTTHQETFIQSKNNLEVTYINVTEACNLHCPYCYADAREESLEELLAEEIEEVIDSSAKLGARRIVFTGGEPFLRREIFDLGCYVKERGLESEIITNGTLIHEKHLEPLLEAFDSIAISLDGSTKEIHEKMRGEGTFEPVFKALKLLANKDILLVVNTVITKYNYRDIPNLNSLVAEVSSFMHNTFLHLPLGRGWGDGLSCNLQEINEMRNLLLESFRRQKDAPFVRTRIKAAPPKRGMTKRSCGAGQTEILVDSRGNLYPCRLLQMDGLETGNIRETPLEDLYSSSERLEQCRLVNISQIKECQECEFSRLCAGSCRAMHYAYTGDFFKNEPWICSYLKEELLLNLWFKEGYFPITREEDDGIGEEGRRSTTPDQR